MPCQKALKPMLAKWEAGCPVASANAFALARALVTNPKLLILDEVTSALDPETESEIVSNIASLRGRYTIIAITHRPAWTKIADRLYTISKGHVSSPKKPGKIQGFKGDECQRQAYSFKAG